MREDKFVDFLEEGQPTTFGIVIGGEFKAWYRGALPFLVEDFDSMTLADLYRIVSILNTPAHIANLNGRVLADTIRGEIQRRTTSAETGGLNPGSTPIGSSSSAAVQQRDTSHASAPRPPLFTIGYQGSQPRAFIEALQRARVEVLIDVRAFPSSRKPGFSKTALARALQEHGIEYVHLQSLGTPKHGREAARSGDIDGYRRIYREHLAGQDAQAALSRAIKIASRSRACLLCFERDTAICHRAMLATDISDALQISVTDLEPN